MTTDVALLVQASRTAGVVREEVGALAVPLEVVDHDLPLTEVDRHFRSPHTRRLGVVGHADHRIGLLTRARYLDALTGRLGYGRAVLSRRPVGDIADWRPLVLTPEANVLAAVTRALERQDERRYDDVVVDGPAWQVVDMADLVRTIVGGMASRSLYDAVTGLPGRAATLHTLEAWSARLGGSERRLMVLVLDVVGFGEYNALAGSREADAYLKAVSGRLIEAVPKGSLVGRTGADEFVVGMLLPAIAPGHLPARLADLRGAVGTATQMAGRPAVRVVQVASPPGWADAALLLQDAQREMRVLKRAGGASTAVEPDRRRGAVG